MAEIAIGATVTYFSTSAWLVGFAWLTVVVGVCWAFIPKLDGVKIPVRWAIFAIAVVVLLVTAGEVGKGYVQRERWVDRRTLTDTQRARIIEALESAQQLTEAGSMIATVNHAATYEAMDFAVELRQVFKDAGWSVRRRFTLNAKDECRHHNMYVGCLVRPPNGPSGNCLRFQQALADLDIEFFDELSDAPGLGEVVVKICRFNYTDK